MPMYEYQCAKHGAFEALRAIEQRTAPARCPNCGERSQRILSVPRLRGMERSALIAHERNERSRHEPRVAHAPAREPPDEDRQRSLHVSHGRRPWVLEHG